MPTVSSIVNHYFVAQTFLTRIPCPAFVDHGPGALAKSTVYFPLVGLFIGLLASGVFFTASAIWTPLIAATLTIAFSIAITGAFHEDGLADSADGLGGGFTLERKLEIMRDSRIGTYGSVALILSILLRVTALAEIPTEYIIPALVIAHMAGRWSSLPLIIFNQYLREDGTGKPFAESVGVVSFYTATLYSSIIVLLLLGLPAFNIIITIVLITISAHFYLRKKIGGITGDTLGAINQCIEIAVFLFFAIK